MNRKEVKPVSSLAIVNTVAAILNLGEFGKVENFFNKAVGTLRREIETAERSKKNAEHNHSIALATYQEQLEDAEATVEDAFTNVNIDKLQTNEMQREYLEVYFSNIDRAEEKKIVIENKIKTTTEAYEEQIKELNEQIDVRLVRLSRLTIGAKQ